MTPNTEAGFNSNINYYDQLIEIKKDELLKLREARIKLVDAKFMDKMLENIVDQNT